jgi:hypothetical protein
VKQRIQPLVALEAPDVEKPASHTTAATGHAASRNAVVPKRCGTMT